MDKKAASNFKRLVGIWKTSGSMISGSDQLTGTDRYELILDGNYILHTANVRLGAEKSETVELIKLESSVDHASMHYFNNKGEDGSMIGFLAGDEFRMEGKELKFEGTINAENTRITGNWYTQSADGKWICLMDIQLEK